ncbi:MAG: hypothetical protein C0601_05015 [Candidatus Muiribacterium halophilum]|uniref:Carbamoyltransferase C-terminal domain-containing protein n=1 Tax=Muiribacterium halophilum TaxID=2053465 RepID=A0A2N5ZIE4_MUIH1|nr:MAG: hypothetical protein C0601_05015 [Candidatus Muirbacterium halophilum]
MFFPYNGYVYSKEEIKSFLKDYENGILKFKIYSEDIKSLELSDKLDVKELTAGVFEISVFFEHEKELKFDIKNNYDLDFGINEIKASKVEFYTDENIYKELAELVSKGSICGFFTLSSETGPRALCARSIIADARYPDMKDRLNREVKHREMFRPFAPVVMHEKGDEYFEDYCFSPYMLETFQIKGKWIHRLPAITHVDNSARIQSVSESSNPSFYRFIKEYSKITDIHVLLNTSFNLAGEPIVESPFHALACFLNSEIDILFIDPFIIKKKCRKLPDNYL